MEYGAPALNITNNANKNKLEVNQNKCLRLINNANITTPFKTLRKTSNITDLNSRLQTLTKKWYNKAKTNQNNIVSKTIFTTLPHEKHPTPLSF